MFRKRVFKTENVSCLARERHDPRSQAEEHVAAETAETEPQTALSAALEQAW